MDPLEGERTFDGPAEKARNYCETKSHPSDVHRQAASDVTEKDTEVGKHSREMRSRRPITAPL